MGESNISILEEQVYIAWLNACIRALGEGEVCPSNPLPQFGV